MKFLSSGAGNGHWRTDVTTRTLTGRLTADSGQDDPNTHVREICEMPATTGLPHTDRENVRRRIGDNNPQPAMADLSTP
jgi:hypothetical protein